MSNETIKRTLDAHSVPYREAGRHIYADSMDASIPTFAAVIDVTGWTFQQLLAWLGY